MLQSINQEKKENLFTTLPYFMELKSFVTLFSGIGGWDFGAVKAGLQCLAAYEINQEYARAYASIFGNHVHVGDVADAMPPIGSCDVLFSSPPCQNFSVASARKACRNRPEEVDARRDVGLVTIRFAESLRPKAILIENVLPYLNSEVFQAIKDGLANYNCYTQKVNASDYGVPSSRKRMVAVFIRSDLDNGSFQLLKKPKVSWLDSLDKRKSSLKKDKLCKWQKERLERWDLSQLSFPLLISGYNCSSTRHKMNKRVRMFKEAKEPAMTMVKSPWAMRSTYILESQDINGDVLKADNHCFASWQSFPDDFLDRLDKKTLEKPDMITEMIGNAVPPDLSFAIINAIQSM